MAKKEPQFDSWQARIAHAWIHSGSMSAHDLAQLGHCVGEELMHALVGSVETTIAKAVELIEDVVEQRTEEGKKEWNSFTEEQKAAFLTAYASRPKQDPKT